MILPTLAEASLWASTSHFCTGLSWALRCQVKAPSKPPQRECLLPRGSWLPFGLGCALCLSPRRRTRLQWHLVYLLKSEQLRTREISFSCFWMARVWNHRVCRSVLSLDTRGKIRFLSLPAYGGSGNNFILTSVSVITLLPLFLYMYALPLPSPCLIIQAISSKCLMELQIQRSFFKWGCDHMFWEMECSIIFRGPPCRAGKYFTMSSSEKGSPTQQHWSILSVLPPWWTPGYWGEAADRGIRIPAACHFAVFPPVEPVDAGSLKISGGDQM